MTEPAINPESSPPLAKGGVTALSYETGAPIRGEARRWWVYAVAGIYVFLLVVMLTLPAWVSLVSDPSRGDLAGLIVCTGAIALCGFSLMVIPIRRVRRRQVTRRSVWFPILGSGFLAGVLVVGGGLAGSEYLRVDGDNYWRILAAAGIVWGVWAVVFGVFAIMGNVEGVGAWLHRSIIAGSVLELLVAVPTHVIVRRRSDCCAGIGTGLGICFGVVVMLVSFGPSVLLLFYRRRKQITGGDS